MDEIFSKEYLESSRRRMGGFSWVVDGLFIKPFPVPCLVGVTVFLPSDSSPTTGSKMILGFLGRRPCFSSSFLFVDGLDEPVSLGCPSTSFFLAAYCLMTALLLATSISTQGKTNGYSEVYKPRSPKMR